MNVARLTGVIVDDPLRAFRVGSTLSVKPVVFNGSDAAVVPDGVTDWTFFDGALLAILVGDSSQSEAMGTAIMVAPGLAITATHVLPDDLDEVVAGKVGLLCVGPTRAGVDLWRVRSVSWTAGDDVAYLSLVLASEISDQWHVATLAITTRTPKLGERVEVVGFRMPTVTNERGVVGMAGQLYASAGTVAAVHRPARDSFAMPFPTIEVACGSLGAMSGGALLDSDGFIVGVTSRGLDTDDGEGPTFATWIGGVLNRQVEIPWPPGLYPQPVHVLDVEEDLLHIEGRDKITIVDANTYTYEIWYDR